MTSIDPQQLHLAADIIEARQAGREPKWEVWRKDSEWTDSHGAAVLAYVSAGMPIRLTPWTLPPCPVDGQTWHRENEWKEDMLEGGWRPVMVGEIIQKGDEVWTNGLGPWDSVLEGTDVSPAMVRMRTRRPALPVQPVVVPYTRDTLPELPFEVVCKHTGDEYLVIGKDDSCVLIGLAWTIYANVLANFTRRDGSPCGTEVQP